MKIFPMVTLDREEFWDNEKPECTYSYESLEDFWYTINGTGVRGLCGNRTIWIENLNPITLTHEFLHFL